MLRDRLEQEIKRCDATSQQLAILFIDLDHFKEVNDTPGPRQRRPTAGGGRTSAYRHCVRGSDTVARMGGDEFTAVILTELTAQTHARAVAARRSCIGQ